MQDLSGGVARLRLYVGERDQFRGRPLYHELVLEAKSAGLAGATVLRGVEGFGAASRGEGSGLLDLSRDQPMVVELVDREEKLRAILPRLMDMLPGGMATLEPVRVLHYGARRHAEA
ncbi:MAG: DUF190 domain-containing protein [Firmicutes bacterium]|nr:DUF190 domain-containing protein [Bacillota bacterium]